MMNDNQLLNRLEELSYICDFCGTKIYPRITDIDLKTGEISASIDNYSLTGGRGNRTLVDQICEECASTMNGVFQWTAKN